MSELHHGLFSLVLYSLDVPTKLMAKVVQHVKALGNPRTMQRVWGLNSSDSLLQTYQKPPQQQHLCHA